MTAHEQFNLLIVLPALIIYVVFSWHFRMLTRLHLVAMTVIAVIGITFDLLLVTAGFIQFSADFIIPAWLACLWSWFAVTFFDCYRWVKNISLKVIALMGSAFGPIAYWSASFFSEVNILQPFAFTIFSGIFWAVLFVNAVLWERQRHAAK